MSWLDNISNPNLDNFSLFNMSKLVSEGFLRVGFNPYITLFGDFFWGLFFGIIGVAIYSWKSNVYALIGYLVAILVLARVVMPVGVVDLIAIILGLAISGLVYKVFVEKKKEKK